MFAWRLTNEHMRSGCSLSYVDKFCASIQIFAERSEHQRTSYGNLKMDNNDFKTTFKQIIAYAIIFGERSRISRDLSLSLVEKSRYTERTTTNTNLQKKINNDFKTTSKRTSAFTSECQIPPEFSRTLAYAGPIRYSVTGPSATFRRGICARPIPLSYCRRGSEPVLFILRFATTHGQLWPFMLPW